MAHPEDSPYLEEDMNAAKLETMAENAMSLPTVTPLAPEEDRARSLNEIVAEVREQRLARQTPAMGTTEENGQLVNHAEREVAVDESVSLDDPEPHWSQRMNPRQLEQACRSIARVCHEANRAYSFEQGDRSHEAWRNSPTNIIDSAISGVRKIITGDVRSPRESHEAWLEYKRAEGWVFGEVKDSAKKTHPCLLEYDNLPPREKVKDVLFHAVVTALTPELQREREAETAQRVDSVYTERNRLVAAFARLARVLGWPVALAKTDIAGWDHEWHNCIFIETPEGQVSWHFHDREIRLFAGLPTTNDDGLAAYPWDGHTTQEKYARLDNVAREGHMIVTRTQSDYDGLKAHLDDVYTALGVRWGDDPFTRITALADADRRLRELQDRVDGALAP